ncbi:hypothetical protein HK098_000797 [Nowakowskiella sp. JEL0407]|nr:hypothetical protein HK098_000797 [Nowakowskiella sp. JEL0407]
MLHIKSLFLVRPLFVSPSRSFFSSSNLFQFSSFNNKPLNQRPVEAQPFENETIEEPTESIEDIATQVQRMNTNPVTATDQLVSQFVNNVMKDGKKERARKALAEALWYIRRTTGENPIKIFADSVSKASPLVKLVTHRRGGKNIQIPSPLLPRQSNRAGILSIVEATNKSGSRDSFGVRLGKELLAIKEGDSATLKKKNLIHKTALANRSFIIMERKK